MKRFVVMAMVLMMVVFMAKTSFASSKFDITVMPKWSFYTDQSLEQGKGIEARLAYKGIFLFGSYDQTMMRLYGQRAGNISLFGVGAGLKVKLVEGLTLAGKLGYFWPESTMAKDPQDFGEVFYYRVAEYLNLLPLTPEQKVNSLAHYSKYEYELKGNFGAAIEAAFEKKICKDVFFNAANGGLFFNLAAGYQFLKLPERFHMRSASNPTVSYIEFFGDKNFSSGTVGVGLTYRW